MVHHIVCWNFKEELSEEERITAGNTIKEKLESIQSCVEGVISIQVKIGELPSSNKDVALLASFDNLEALNAYQTSPEHVEAGNYIRSVVCDRACFDYED
ncbi:MAG: Dabb family protein [Roseburia sp.]|nr:Dabb family protein [Roseburia sp.]MCM1278967.1 Dabb family protein [Robinsoniella sp.]